jgi:hypothetical protein
VIARQDLRNGLLVPGSAGAPQGVFVAAQQPAMVLQRVGLVSGERGIHAVRRGRGEGRWRGHGVDRGSLRIQNVRNGRSRGPSGRRIARRSRDDAVLEYVILRPVTKVIQVQVQRRGVVILEHVVPIRLEPKERRLCAVGAVPWPRRQFPFCAATARSGWVES